MSSKEGLGILDVIENLNTLVEANSLEEIVVTEEGRFIATQKSAKGYWMHVGANEETFQAIRGTFRIVLKHLQVFYRKMKQSGDKKRYMEGINTIMVLVGEAEKKLETFDRLFKERLPKLEEYRNLQAFYKNKIIKESFKEFNKVELTKPRLGKSQLIETLSEEEKWEKEYGELVKDEEIEEIQGVHLLNDIEVIKGDHFYELFYMKNEAGHSFYTQELAKQLKLACDFGEFSQQYFGDDPLLQIKNWEDKSLHLLAKQILEISRPAIEKFYKEALHYKEMELVSSLHNALISLKLAANPRNLIRQLSPKGCYLYFRDFQFFLREALGSREYQKFLIYSPPETTPFFSHTLHLIHTLMFNYFTLGPDRKEVRDSLLEMIERKDPKIQDTLSSFLNLSDDALREVLSHHPSGPVFKALDLIREEDEESQFDPLIQDNIPEKEARLRFGEKEITFLRLPCLIIQDQINHALITEEFKTFLHVIEERKAHLLMVNFQDRTSWKEHARVSALDELSHQAEYASIITLVTCAKDTDFYNQKEEYESNDESMIFIDHFLSHLRDESTGYSFPSQLKEKILGPFISELMGHIHQFFFHEKPTLSLRMRLDFIEIAYQFIILKLLDELSPDYLALSSKDALDIGGSSVIAFQAFLAIGLGKTLKSSDLESMNTILYGPTLMVRERAIHPERFERLYEMVCLLEEKKGFLKNFSSLFNNNILDIEVFFEK